MRPGTLPYLYDRATAAPYRARAWGEGVSGALSPCLGHQLQVIDTRCWPHPSRVPSSHGWTPLLRLHSIMAKHVRRACPVETDASMPYADTQVLTCTLDAARRVRAHYRDDATAAAPMWERAHQLLDGLEGQPTASPHRGPRGACQGVRNVVGKATGCWRREAGRVEAHPDARGRSHRQRRRGRYATSGPRRRPHAGRRAPPERRPGVAMAATGTHQRTKGGMGEPTEAAPPCGSGAAAGARWGGAPLTDGVSGEPS